MVYTQVNYNISGQLKDDEDGSKTAKLVDAELRLICAKYGLDIEGGIDWED